MGRIKSITAVLFLSILGSAVISSAQTEEPENINSKYRKIYPYVTYPDTVYTFESEFIFPEGYARPDSLSLPEFSNWVSRMPLWYAYKAIGNWKGMKIKEYTEVSRAVHLPWKGPTYRDKAFPIRILAEYFVYKKTFDSFKFIPDKGDVITYDIWLSGTPAQKAGGEIFFRKDVSKRERSLREFYAFMNFTFVKLTYGTLKKNCDEVKPDDILPGDIYIASDSTGKKGKVLFIMNKIVSEGKEPLYIFATSGEEACDFHIPLVNEDRNNPWMTAAEIIKYAGQYDSTGFYRFKVLND